MADWRDSTVVAAVAVGVFLLAMLLVPVSRLGADGASRFAWQMFSHSTAPTEFVVETTSGEVEVSLGEITARPRTDLPIESLVPPYLCETVPGAESVSWDGGSHQC